MATLFLKVLPNFCGNLAIRHLVRGLILDDAPLEPLFLKAYLEFTLGFAGTKDLNSFCVTKIRNDVVVETDKMVSKLPVTHVLSRTFFGFTAGKSDVLLHFGSDLFYFFAFVCESNNNRLPMVNPQTHLLFHNYLHHQSASTTGEVFLQTGFKSEKFLVSVFINFCLYPLS